MLRTLWAFVRLALRPFPRLALNIMGFAGVTGGAVALWISQHWEAGVMLALGALAVAFAVAGHRLQKTADTIKATEAQRAMLGRFLMLGQHVLPFITSAATRDWGLDQANSQPGDDLWNEAIRAGDEARDKMREWEELAERHLQQRYGPAHVARFRSDSGLPDTPMDYDFFGERWQKMWRHMHCRFIRLEEFIKEIPREG